MPNTGRILPNTLLHSRYLILQVVGSGGMGSVYKAQDVSPQGGRRFVAVKEMSYQDVTTPEDLKKIQELFRKEAEMLERLSHVNLPRVYDYFYEQGRPYLVMDFIEGETLRQRCERSPERRLPIGEVLAYGIQLCEVLAYLHQQRRPIVFRDLKPSNVMVTPNGHLYLIDFGIARIFKPEQTKDTQQFMSLGFSAPELVSKGRTEPRSDLYSLGATLHYCLTGQTNELYQVFPLIRLPNQQISFQINNLMTWLTAHDPRKRPHNASTIMYTLLQAQHSLSEPADLHNENNPYADPGGRTERVPLHEDWRPRFRAGMRWLWNSVIILWAFLIEQVAQKTGKWLLDACQRVYQVGNNAFRWPMTPKKPPSSRSLDKNLGLVKMAQQAIIGVQSYVSIPFALLPLLTATSSVYMLTVLHIQANVVLLFFSIILLLLAFGTSLNRQINGQDQKQTHYILVVIAIGTLIVCSALPLQSDVQNTLAKLTLSQLLSILMLTLGLLALLRPGNGFVRIDHILVILVAIICGYNPVLFLIQALHTPDHINGLVVAAVAIPSFVILISLVRLLLRYKFSTWDRVLVLILVIIYICIQIYMYSQKHDGNQLPVTTGIVLLLLFLVTLMTLQPPMHFPLIGRIPLLFLVTLCSLSPPTFADASSPSNPITTMLEKSIGPNQAIGYGCVLLAFILLRQTFAGRRSAQIVTLTIIGTAVVCILLQISALNNAKPIYPSFVRGLDASLIQINWLMISIQAIATGIAVLVALLSVFLHLTLSGQRSQNAVNKVDQIKEFMSRFMVLASILACALLQWGWGSSDNEPLPLDIAGIDVKLAVIGVMIVIVTALLNSHKKRSSDWGYCLAMCIVAIVCALLFFGKKELPLPTLYPTIITQSNFRAVVFVGYSIAIAAAFVWLRNVPHQMNPWVLRIIFGCALLCMILQFFWYDLIIVVPLMLIQGVLLVVGLTTGQNYRARAFNY